MTLFQLIKIQSIIDKRAIRSDTEEFLNQTRYSKSTDKHIKYGDMHIDHFIRVFVNLQDEDLLIKLIQNAIKKGFFKPANPFDLVMQEQINQRDKKKDN